MGPTLPSGMVPVPPVPFPARESVDGPRLESLCWVVLHFNSSGSCRRCWAHALVCLMPQTALVYRSSILYILVPTSTGSCPSPAVGGSACPACGDTSSGAKLAASSPYKGKSPLSANLAFSASSPQGLKSPGLPQRGKRRRRKRTHVVGDTEEGRVAALIQTVNQRLWFRIWVWQHSLSKAVQQPESQPCWRITLVLTVSVSSGWASEQVCPTDSSTLVLARRALGRGQGSDRVSVSWKSLSSDSLKDDAAESVITLMHKEFPSCCSF